MLVKLEALKEKNCKVEKHFPEGIFLRLLESENKVTLVKIEALKQKIVKWKDIFHREFTFTFFESIRDCKTSLLFFVTPSG